MQADRLSKCLCGILFSLFWGMLVFSGPVAVAQQGEIFGGRGIDFDRDDDSSRTRAFDFSALRADRDESTEEKTETRFQFPKLKAPQWQWPKLHRPAFFDTLRDSMKLPKPFRASESPSEDDGGESSSVTGSLFPKRDPDEPGFFEKWNEHNRKLWEQTKTRFPFRLGSHDSGDPAGDDASLNRLARGFEGTAHRDPPMAQPPLRSTGRRISRQRR